MLFDEQQKKLMAGFHRETISLATARFDLSPHSWAHHSGTITVGLRGGFFVAAVDMSTERADEHFQVERNQDTQNFRHDRAFRTPQGALENALRTNLNYVPSAVQNPALRALLERPRDEEPTRIDSYLLVERQGMAPSAHAFSIADAESGQEAPLMERLRQSFRAGKISGADPRIYAGFIATQARDLSLLGQGADGLVGQLIADGTAAVSPQIVSDMELYAQGAVLEAPRGDRDGALRLAAIEKTRRVDGENSLVAVAALEKWGLELYRAGKAQEAFGPLLAASHMVEAARQEQRAAKQVLASAAQR